MKSYKQDDLTITLESETMGEAFKLGCVAGRLEVGKRHVVVCYGQPEVVKVTVPVIRLVDKLTEFFPLLVIMAVPFILSGCYLIDGLKGPGS